jgi:hypothetical protein
LLNCGLLMMTATPFVKRSSRSECQESLVAIVTLSLADSPRLISALGDDATPLHSLHLVAPPGMKQQGLGHRAQGADTDPLRLNACIGKLPNRGGPNIQAVAVGLGIGAKGSTGPQLFQAA